MKSGWVGALVGGSCLVVAGRGGAQYPVEPPDASATEAASAAATAQNEDPMPTTGDDRSAPLASAQRPRYHLQYVAPPGCPKEDALRQALAEYPNLGAWEADRFEHAGVVRVTVEAVGNEYRARMVQVDETGECSSVANHASNKCDTAVAEISVDVAEVLRPGRRCRREGPRRGELGMAVGGMSFIPGKPDIAWGPGLALGYRGGAWLFDTPWSTRVLAYYGDSGSLELGNDLSTRYQLWTLRAYICPIEPRLPGPFSLPLCVAGEVGSLKVEGWAPRLWGALEAAPRLRWLTGTVFAELEAAVLFPMMRYRFEDSGKEAIHWIGASGRAILGVRF